MANTFTMSKDNRENLFRTLSNLDSAKLWDVSWKEHKSTRSLGQNDWMRGFARDFGNYFGYDADYAYELLMYKFCPVFITTPEGDEVRMPGSFSRKPDGSKRNTVEAAEIQDEVQRWAASVGFFWEGM